MQKVMFSHLKQWKNLVEVKDGALMLSITQIEGVQVDDSKTRSKYTTLNRGLRPYAKDIMDGTYQKELINLPPGEARMNAEDKGLLNLKILLRAAHGDKSVRTMYGT